MSSDPTRPPFSQKTAPPVQTGAVPPSQSSMAPASFPGIQYDNSGRPWFRGPGGEWIGSSHFQPNLQSPQQAPFPSQLDRSAQSAAQFDFRPPFPSQPHASATQALNFPPAGPSSHYPPVVDPLLLPPLPDDEDLDLSDPATIAKARLKPATKVADVRVKDTKGKKRRYSSDSDNHNSEAERPSKRGRRKGSQNWSKEDIKKLLDLVQKALPLGQKGWKTVTERFCKWADASKRPQRDGKAIESKYKALLKTKKPTGDAYCPPEIKRAHQIEDLINQHADTRELSDDSDAGDESDDSIEVLDHSAVRTAVARRAPTPPLRRNSRMNAPELVNRLSQAFDPAALRSRDEERSQRSFQTTQFFALTQQLRDAQAANEGLRNQLAVVQNHTHDVERARDRAELRLERYEQGPFGGSSQHRSRAQYIAEEYPDLVRCDGKIRNGDDSEKENKDPSSSSSGRLSSPFDLTTSSSSSSFSLPQPSSSSSGADLPGPSTAGTGPSDV